MNVKSSILLLLMHSYHHTDVMFYVEFVVFRCNPVTLREASQDMFFTHKTNIVII